MSSGLYENYFSGDSNSKAKDDHNFELNSFDANNQDNIYQTLGSSSRRDDENNINNKLGKNESKFQQNDKILEDIEEKIENNKINNRPDNNKITQNNELETEKEENPFNKKSNIPKKRKNSKTIIITPPLIDRISDLKIDYNNYNINNLTKREKEYYEKDIDERKNENEKLKQQYEKELQKLKEAVDNLKEQNENKKEKLIAQTENKIKELDKKEELMTQNIENEQKYSEKLIMDEEENIKKLNEKKIELKKKDIENQKVILKRQ